MQDKGSRVILPPATIGILGGGQLGRMLILAGRPLGYRFRVFEPKAGNCAGSLADLEVNAPYDDRAALARFAEGCDVITLEFENIPTQALDELARHAPLRPGARALEVCQHRRKEKQLFAEAGVPCAPWASADSPAALAAALEKVGTPCVVKTATLGYDGKGQIKLEQPSADAAALWRELGEPAEVVVEGWVEFEGEYSAICARSATGETRVFPMPRNVHRNHILYQSILPGGLAPETEAEGARIATQLAEALGLVGLLAVEFFHQEGRLIANEMAPRPHNSGHWTIDGCLTSQFEQHIRAICGLPLGATDLRQPCTMTNLLGDAWQDGTADWPALLSRPGLRLHLYDKGDPRPGRKMGHFTELR